LRLKSLELQGYKSFANKVEFIFDKGITAVVGPNGSGKSNVADAIRWVLGEQSYTNLRGKKTEDMIFSGSDGRARLGMASVTLVLDNANKWLPLDFSEVTIARRAYRSGENEYYLNGSRVRLRDIGELLAKGGMSRQTYTVIGQGTIDRVLSLHAEERRKLFEEAAGITFHHQKRAEALSRLEATQANLLRLNDIVKEIEPRLRQLEKQAERAREYSLIKAHLDGLLRIWYGYQWGQHQLELRAASTRLHESQTLVTQQRARLRDLSRQLDLLRTEQTEARASLSLWYAENNQLNKQAETIQRELAVSEERARQYAAQRAEILAELQPLAAELETRQQQITAAQAALQSINQELAEAETVTQQLQHHLEAYQSQQADLASRQATAEAEVRQLATELNQGQARLAQRDERRAILVNEQEARAVEIGQITTQQQELKQQQSQLAGELKLLEAELLALEAQQAQQRERLAQLNQEAEQFKAQLSALHREENSLKARLDVLDKLRSDMAGYFAGVRAVLEPKSGLTGIIGTISQVIQAPPDLEVALEAALGGRLQDIVVKTFADAEAAIAYLKETRKGRVTLLPLDTIRVGPPVTVPKTPGVIGLASELASVGHGRLQPVIEFTLNRTVIVEDLPAARRAFTAMSGGFQIVTREGELMRSGGSVTGGRDAGNKGSEGTFLAREREWRTLPEQIAAVATKQEAISVQLADNQEKIANTRKEGQTLLDRRQQKERQQQELQAAADKANHALEQLAQSLSWQHELQNKAEAELAQIDQRQNEERQKMAQAQQARQAAELLARQLAQEAQALSAENLLLEFNQAQAAATALQARQTNQQTILTTHQAVQRQVATQIEQKQTRAESLAAERETLLQKQQELRQRSAEFEGRLAELAERVRAGEKNLAELEVNQLQLQHDDSNLRQRLQRLEVEHSRLSLEAARCQDQLDNLQRHIHEDLGLVQLEMSEEQIGQPVLPIVSDLPVVKELPPGVEEDVKRLKVQIRRLGNINPDAPREYAELHQRHHFLSHQIADLEAAVTDLREVIARLDTAMQEAFTGTFQKVAKEFQRYFKELFGGGEAQLLLTNPDNLIETGIDIVARPPGKRLQSLALLSGGERSLTAQALIFALLRVSPTPFVIFDEVDAMLDEANVSRFRDALANLAGDIQFIVITHNRKTIEAASTLYGVSMGDDSVSQVYSLKIEEWVEEKRAA
jgi:chromosome segregation protein